MLRWVLVLCLVVVAGVGALVPARPAYALTMVVQSYEESAQGWEFQVGPGRIGESGCGFGVATGWCLGIYRDGGAMGAFSPVWFLEDASVEPTVRVSAIVRESPGSGVPRWASFEVSGAPVDGSSWRRLAAWFCGYQTSPAGCQQFAVDSYTPWSGLSRVYAEIDRAGKRVRIGTGPVTLQPDWAGVSWASGWVSYEETLDVALLRIRTYSQWWSVVWDEVYIEGVAPPSSGGGQVTDLTPVVTAVDAVRTAVQQVQAAVQDVAQRIDDLRGLVDVKLQALEDLLQRGLFEPGEGVPWLELIRERLTDATDGAAWLERINNNIDLLRDEMRQRLDGLAHTVVPSEASLQQARTRLETRVQERMRVVSQIQAVWQSLAPPAGVGGRSQCMAAPELAINVVLAGQSIRMPLTGAVMQWWCAWGYPLMRLGWWLAWGIAAMRTVAEMLGRSPEW